MYKEFGYTIRDVTKTLTNYITKFDLKVFQEGIVTRVKIDTSAPDEAISNKITPMIYINPHFNTTIPKVWRRPKEVISSEYDVDNPAILKTTFGEIRNVFMQYQIGFLVEYSHHCDYLTEKFIEMFPLELYLDYKAESDDDYMFVFFNDGKVIPLDFIKDNKKIYRRDIILSIRLSFNYEKFIEELTSFGGVYIQQVELNNLLTGG
jgi:hypothetical protein